MGSTWLAAAGAAVVFRGYGDGSGRYSSREFAQVNETL